MQLSQKICPQVVDVSSFIVSMQITHLSFRSSSFSCTGESGGKLFMNDASTGTFFRFRLCNKKSKTFNQASYNQLPRHDSPAHLAEVRTNFLLGIRISTQCDATKWTLQKVKIPGKKGKRHRDHGTLGLSFSKTQSSSTGACLAGVVRSIVGRTCRPRRHIKAGC
jgi:hypothetical protein